MKILLVDDHTLFLEGLQNLLTAQGQQIVGRAQDGFSALEQTRRLKPDIVLMDIQMPRCDGIEATRLIKAEMPDVKIVMLTMSTEDEHLFEAIKSGASGYLLKDLEAEHFLEMLMGLERGEAAMTRDLAAKVMAEFAFQAQAPERIETENDDPSALTERQLEVLELLAQGLTNKEIGNTLFITERTVKYHIREIFQKLHLRNRAQVISYAVREGLITNPLPS